MMAALFTKIHIGGTSMRIETDRLILKSTGFPVAYKYFSRMHPAQ